MQNAELVERLTSAGFVAGPAAANDYVSFAGLETFVRTEDETQYVVALRSDRIEAWTLETDSGDASGGIVSRDVDTFAEIMSEFALD